MNKNSITSSILFPFLQLKIKDKIIFFLIIFFSLSLIFFDLLTISILASVFFESSSLLIENINNVLNLFHKKTNIMLNFTHFKISIIVGFLISRNIFFILLDYNIRSFVFKIYYLNTKKIFNIYASSDLKKFNSKSIHHYIKNINKETWYCYIGVLYGFLYLSVDLIYFITLLSSVYYILNIEFSISLFSIICSFVLIILFLFSRIKKLGKKRQGSETKYYRETLNILKSYLEIKIYNKIDYFTNNFAKHLKNFCETHIFQGIINLLPKAIIEILISLTLLFYLIFNDEELDLELFTLIGLVMFRLAPVITRLIQNTNLIIFYYPASKILINEEKFYSNKDKNKKINFDINSLSLKDISFNYSKQKIFKHFNYKFLKNNIYGISGRSGKGKTTLMMILSGLIDIDKGKFKINDLDFTNKRIDWSKKIGMMSQYNTMIDDSLIQTLFMDEAYDQKSINLTKKYLIKFKLKKLIKYLDKKYDGCYSLDGMLSGGEKQRISILRTILLGGEILFLDEPTSSLDKINEQIVMKEFQKLKKNRIIIISTHKKELINQFDHIINL